MLRLYTLHAGLDRVERLRDVHRDQARQATDPERRDGAELLARSHVRLGKLLQEVVRPEARRGVGGLARSRRHEALEETPDAALARDDRDRVEEAAQAGLRGFSVVDPAPVSLCPALNARSDVHSQRCFDTLKGSDGKQRLGDTSAESSDDCPRTRNLSIGILEERFVLVEGDEADAGFEGVADDKGGATGIPGAAERRPGKLFCAGETLV